ncbi:putative WRKY transcription factor 35 [Dorcoceras hygrometricum]|uniref:Putative WRKY transcription factor 35 n=1 Tax=Dorcoceras hygrometricum TaxID=472368 RepID=A0A2Z7CDN2_9LAMI|nr:putative WRKY transcription factor 35 [Dorcoceras hygrometricum]
MQHAIINAMKCMRVIKDRIARPVYQLANYLNQPLYPHGVSTGEIIGPLSSEPVSPSQLGGRHSNPVVTTLMIALDFSGTTHQSDSHNVAFNQNSNPVPPLNKVLTVHTKLRTVGIPYLEAETSGRTIKFHCTKKPATLQSSLRSFDSLNWVTIGRETHKESSATKFTQNNGGKRRQSTEKSHGEQ